MNTADMRKVLEERARELNWHTSWNKDEQKLAIYHQASKKPVRVSIPQLIKRMQTEKQKAEELIEETVHQIKVVQQSMEDRKTLRLIQHERDIFPVMRSSSFPEQTENDQALVFEEHTAESRIYFAVDRNESYILIDRELLEEAGWSPQELKEKALFNLRGLKHDSKRDEVAGNHFYFISPQDGYAASRILHLPLLKQYAEQAQGDFCVAIPHQDVLVLADLRNERGYDVLGQMAMHFYRNGDMPITPLSFTYQKGELEPIFILSKRKPDQS